MKAPEEYKLVIWDMDGTLYHQPPFRRKMALVLLQGLLFAPGRWRELWIIWNYRKLREKWPAGDTQPELELRQYEAAGKACGVSKEQVQAVIAHWMLQTPLSHLKEFRNEWAAAQIRQLREKGVHNVIYSDYPAEDKARALGIEAERCFCSQDREIGCMKPNPRGILYILEEMGTAPRDALMVGDRYEKDGMAAAQAGIDCVILGKSGQPACEYPIRNQD